MHTLALSLLQNLSLSLSLPHLFPSPSRYLRYVQTRGYESCAVRFLSCSTVTPDPPFHYDSTIMGESALKFETWQFKYCSICFTDDPYQLYLPHMHCNTSTSQLHDSCDGGARDLCPRSWPEVLPYLPPALLHLSHQVRYS